jgi:type II secretory pathway pseudopilin PulG
LIHRWLNSDKYKSFNASSTSSTQQQQQQSSTAAELQRQELRQQQLEQAKSDELLFGHDDSNIASPISYESSLSSPSTNGVDTTQTAKQRRASTLNVSTATTATANSLGDSISTPQLYNASSNNNDNQLASPEHRIKIQSENGDAVLKSRSSRSRRNSLDNQAS